MIAALLGFDETFGTGSAPIRVTSWFHCVVLNTFGARIGAGVAR